MTRDQIVDTTYRVAHGLNELKHARNLIDEPTYQVVDGHLRRAQETLALIDQALELPPAERADALAAIRRRVGEANEASLCAVDELKWDGAARLTPRPRALARLGPALCAEAGHSWHRTAGTYDTPSSPAAASRRPRQAPGTPPATLFFSACPSPCGRPAR